MVCSLGRLSPQYIGLIGKAGHGHGVKQLPWCPGRNREKEDEGTFHVEGMNRILEDLSSCLTFPGFHHLPTAPPENQAFGGPEHPSLEAGRTEHQQTSSKGTPTSGLLRISTLVFWACSMSAPEVSGSSESGCPKTSTGSSCPEPCAQVQRSSAHSDDEARSPDVSSHSTRLTLPPGVCPH